MKYLIQQGRLIDGVGGLDAVMDLLIDSGQIAAVGTPDVLLVPVGGVYTVDAREAKAVCDALSPRWIIPMHYRHAPYGLPNVAGVEDFLALWPEVRRLEGASLEVDKTARGVVVPKFPGEV